MDPTVRAVEVDYRAAQEGSDGSRSIGKEVFECEGFFVEGG